jgi:hypothetical protein
MIAWCKQNLSPIDPNFQFFHHDVYSPSYASGNSLRLAEPFPVQDEGFTFFIAHSVFTHLTREQTRYYLYELARVLKPQGVAFTSWFFFDRGSFPFLLDGPFCLYTSEADFSQAVIYDRGWFIDQVRHFGLGVRITVPPLVAGHQWAVLLGKRVPNAVDQFPLGPDGAEWLCGTTMKPMATATSSPEVMEKVKGRRLEKGESASSDSHVQPGRPQPPALSGALAQLEQIQKSWPWRIWRAASAPARALKRLVQR